MIEIPLYPLATIEQAEPYMKALIGTNLTDVARLAGITMGRNKGWAGNTVEYLLGLERSLRIQDGLNYEAKVLAGRDDGKGGYTIKSEAAITMLNPNLVCGVPFQHSKLRQKLARVLWLIVIERPEGVFLADAKFTDIREWPAALKSQIRKDYDDIRNLLEEGAEIPDLSGSMGVCVMPKTKGAGGGAKKTRAFYARADFLNVLLGQEDYLSRFEKRRQYSDLKVEAVRQKILLRERRETKRRIDEAALRFVAI